MRIILFMYDVRRKVSCFIFFCCTDELMEVSEAVSFISCSVLGNFRARLGRGVISKRCDCITGRGNDALFSNRIDFWLLAHCWIELAGDCILESALG